MATRDIEPGPTARRTADNLAKIRDERRMSQTELADRMSELGRPVTASVISKTEKLDRRMDVDDLVAFAVALGVTPNRLLLPASVSDDESVELLPEDRVSAFRAWKWANGAEPLHEGFSSHEHYQFIKANQPNAIQDYDNPPAYTDARQNPGLVNMVAAVVNEADELNITVGRLIGLISLVERWRLVGRVDAEIAKLYGGESDRQG